MARLYKPPCFPSKITIPVFDLHGPCGGLLHPQPAGWQYNYCLCHHLSGEPPGFSAAWCCGSPGTAACGRAPCSFATWLP